MNLFIKVSSILVFIVLSSCGNSPLYNHKNEGDHSKNPQITDVRDCTLKFLKVGFCGNIQWAESNSPHEGGDSRFVLRLWPADAPGVYQDPEAKLLVSLFMPSMGHGSEPVVLVRQTPGTYEVTNVRFFMAGDWDLKVQFRDANNQVLDGAKLSVEIRD